MTSSVWRPVDFEDDSDSEKGAQGTYIFPVNMYYDMVQICFSDMLLKFLLFKPRRKSSVVAKLQPRRRE